MFFVKCERHEKLSVTRYPAFKTGATQQWPGAEIVQEQVFYVWTEGLSDMDFLQTQNLSGIVWT